MGLIGGTEKEEKRDKGPTLWRRLLAKKGLLIGGLIFTIFVAVFLVALLLPKANINLVVKAEKISHDFNFKVNKNIVSADANNIPGEILESTPEGTKKAQASGKKEVGTKASGKITVFNSYDSNVHSYPAGTKFTSGGKNFLANSSFSVPGATVVGGEINPGQVTVTVTAEAIGEEYNLAPATYTISGAPAQISGSGAAMTGGSKKQVTVISQNDVDSTKNALIEELKNKALEELKGKVTQEQELLDKALGVEVLESKTTPAVGEEATEFETKIRLKVSAFIYKKADFEKLSNDNFSQEISGDKVLVSLDSAKLTKEVTNLDIASGIMEVSVSGEGLAGPKLDEKKLKANLAGMRKQEAEEYLSGFNEIDSVQIHFWPFWVKKIPALEKSIKIQISYSEETIEQPNQ
jgi:hypothetical protein